MQEEDRNYCVYLHRRYDNNDIIYVGEGRIARARSFGKNLGRSKEYATIQTVTKLYYEIYKDNLTKAEAEALEEELIREYKEQGVPITNKANKSTCAKMLRSEDFNKLFYIDPASPSGLRWLTDRYNLKTRGYKLKSKDDLAGSKNKLTGYWSYINIACHRIVYALAHGECPAVLTVDHIDGNKDNNSVENLQLLTRGQNSSKAHIGKEYPQGENVSTSKVTNEQILEMYKMFREFKSNEEVAARFNLHSRYVSLVRHGRRWKKLYKQNGEIFNESFEELAVTVEQVRQALKLIAEGKINKEISELTRIEVSTVSRLRHGKTLTKIVNFLKSNP